jgi:hypothetical protein
MAGAGSAVDVRKGDSAEAQVFAVEFSTAAVGMRRSFTAAVVRGVGTRTVEATAADIVTDTITECFQLSPNK